MRVLRNANLPVSRWHNGAGRKADLATGDGWLAGFAWLDQDAPFSNLPGMARTITLVEGPGFTLDIAGHLSLPVDRMHAQADFDGGQPTHCRITGPSRVLNAMTDRSRYTHSVTITSAIGRIDPLGAVACLVVLLSGSARISDAVSGVDLGVLDAVQLDRMAEIGLTPGSILSVLSIASASGP